MPRELSLYLCIPPYYSGSSVLWINLLEWQEKLHCLIAGQSRGTRASCAGPPCFRKWPWQLLDSGRCSLVPPRQVLWHLRDILSKGEEYHVIPVNSCGLWVCSLLLSHAQCALSHAEPVHFVRIRTWFAGSWQFWQRFVLALWWAVHQVINFPIQAGSGGQDMSLSDS